MDGRDRHEVEDLRGLSLPVAVDPADPLLQPGRVERDVEVDQPVAVGLQVDALAGGVGGHQHPNRLLGRVLAEPGPGRSPGPRPAVEPLDRVQHRPVAAAAPARRTIHSSVAAYSVKITTRSFDQVLPSGRQIAVQERDQRLQPGVGPVLVAVAPVGQRGDVGRACGAPAGRCACCAAAP